MAKKQPTVVCPVSSAFDLERPNVAAPIKCDVGHPSSNRLACACAAPLKKERREGRSYFPEIETLKVRQGFTNCAAPWSPVPGIGGSCSGGRGRGKLSGGAGDPGAEMKPKKRKYGGCGTLFGRGEGSFFRPAVERRFNLRSCSSQYPTTSCPLPKLYPAHSRRRYHLPSYAVTPINLPAPRRYWPRSEAPPHPMCVACTCYSALVLPWRGLTRQFHPGSINTANTPFMPFSLGPIPLP